MKMRPEAERRAQSGFTLVEVLVALLIIAIALTTVTVTMGRMLTNANLMRDRTYASWIAQNRIAQMRAEGTVPELGRTNGDVEFAGGEWDWEAVVSETGIERLLRIDVTVSHAGDDNAIRTVTGFIGDPTPPGIANNLWTRGVRDRDTAPPGETN